ncbi:MAG: dihydrolipoyllysine-residue acetyltransferase [Gammaproteobacteria bacterium]|uniref:dihydrolipoyllysine-residue acetyltransferase n=1 Tax=Rhodoferax sp. TaxID=50421 RepID=UPI001804E5EE|nr:dihydrolipoyllysine-residue acetyltransferase [Rhodoferax sp.]MBU3899535.1 dihydrolipoyllysine-residue acetyltransferase [Gammaproteobacteria bacterium]MBA3059605.1 dihydrolipoyllysine-residue acetyltransferase [Rhodoferax sp.]MBU3997096.1 dihydrolipoyllysine-residue acetyltransferase [Gammaproteobacteria bacterium]MBU4018011.1 dihydrolipoyllysine-residue acetyltransferase [Gammaproteobacteria bacterium]MBU4080298.1 dihydrolipoyllysine-residue acetyltransferase [Gammaproteobacteria bacteriu
MSLIEVKVPDIGDFDEVAVIELLVKPGDSVSAEQSLITVESDKASMEIPSSAAGIVKELKVALGDKVKQGSLVLILEAADAAQAVAAPVTATPEIAQESKPNQAVAHVVPEQAAINIDSSSVGSIEVHVPDIGDFKDVTVIEVMVKVGDAVRLEQSLMTVESDKASMEIPSSAAGVIKELKVKLGDKVNIGDLLAVLEGSAAAAAAVPGSAPVLVTPAASSSTSNGPVAQVEQALVAPVSIASVAAAAAMPAHNPSTATVGLPHASPSVRKFARELGVPLGEVKGSGLKGRITDHDVQAFTRSVMSGAVQTLSAQAQPKAAAAAGGNDGAGLGLIPWPKVDFAKFGPVERKEMSRIKKISGANLLRNAIMIPAVTNHDDCDITDLEAFRVSTNKENEKSGVKVTMLAFLIKACVAALKKYPEFNSSLDGDALIYKQYYHIGFAADTPNGLMVPVIKDADKKGIFQISAEMSELAKKARDGKLSPAEMSGASFTISSLGGIGGRYFTPIINAPEVSILGVCRSTIEPVWDGKAFQPRLMLPLSLTWDHRVIDGAAAARFNVYLGQILGDLRRVLL